MIQNMKGGIMKTQIIETKLNKKTRTYQLDGPQYDSVLSFWTWLKEKELIEDFTISRLA